MQDGFHHIIRLAGRLRAGHEKVYRQLVENLHLDLHKYLNKAIAALQSPATKYCSRLDGSVFAAATRITDALNALV